MVTPVLLDASIIVALLDRSEKRQAECIALVEGLDRPLVTCEAVIAESYHLLRRVPGAAAAIVVNVEQGIFQIPFQLAESAGAVHALMQKYRDIPASLADACLIQMADELNTGDILTLDSDFISYRWRRTHTFRLLIPPLR